MELELLEADPFYHLGEKPLGRGNSDVWKVIHKHDAEVYARKEFLLRGYGDERLKRKIDKEISIMATTQHHHIVEFCGSHHLREGNIIGILLRPVADMSLAGWFESLDNIDKSQENNPRRLEACRIMCRWPLCLFQALDYLHSNRIRHKDIKPSNILIKNDRVYLSDFGISGDFRNATTSKTEGLAGAISRRYVAPEVYNEERRGRAADVWALGCTVLEICTVASGQNTIEGLNKHLRPRERAPTPPFHRHPYRVFDWIWLLLASPGPETPLNQHIQKMLQLTFLMLDPNQSTRITVSQLLDLLNQKEPGYFRSIALLACDNCKVPYNAPMRNAFPHSVFKRSGSGGICIPSRPNFPHQRLWEEVKQRWLESHVWWPSTARTVTP